MPKLVVNDNFGRREVSIEGEVTLGRDTACQVVVVGPLVSRRHARIFPHEGAFVVEDLGSSNGTFVKGERVQRRALTDGDEVRLGNTAVTFHLSDPAPQAQPRPATDAAMRTVVSSMDVAGPDLARSAEQSAPAELRTRLRALHDVAEITCGSLETEEIVRRILDALLAVYPQADHAHAVVYGLGEGGADLRVSAHRGEQAVAAEMSRTLMQLAAGQLKAVLTRDVSSDERFSAAMSIVTQHLRSAMCCPLVVRDRLLGAIQVDTAGRGRPFGQEDLRLLVAVAGQAAVAAENARLHREAVARQRLAAMGEAISSIAHCIKNVLQAQQSGAYLVDMGFEKEKPDMLAKGWAIVKRNNGFLFDLVQDMLAYCRKTETARQAVDAAEVMRETHALVQESAAGKGVDLGLAVPAKATLMIDATGLKRAVLNLLTNAIEACKAGDRVSLAMEMPADTPGWLRITVQDTGPGMPEDVRRRLFEPFFTTKGGKGTGLGLALVRKVVTDHGGRVEVESAPGRGAAFHLFLPLAADAADTGNWAKPA
jgi:signal transduction histidine kinase